MKTHLILRARRAFTLVELLVVIAITAILLTIILLPMFQGFNLTRAAQGYADAQEKARSLSEKISREIGNAAAVRDPSGVGGTVFVRIPVPQLAEDETGAKITPAKAGTTVQLPLQYSKLDLIPPAEGEPGRGPGGAFINPTTGKEDPTLAAPKGQVTFPLAAGTRLVRYFVGLRDPFRPYNNPYDGLLMARGGGRDNLYVLYRAEVEPVVTRRIGGADQVVVNTDFFDLDPNDASGKTPKYDDPGFFLPTVLADGTIDATDGKAIRIGKWLRRATVQTEISRYDLVSAEYNQSARLVRVDASGNPKLLPLLQFRPDRIANDPASGQTALQLGSEADGGLSVGPETFGTKFGAWSNGVVRVYPQNWNLTTTGNKLYSVGKEFTDGANKRRNGIFAVDAGTAQSDADPANGLLLFDSTQYLEAKRAGRRFLFSEALASADGISAWLSNTNPAYRRLFTPFVVDAERGTVTAGFGIGEIGPLTGSTLTPAQQLPSGPANSYAGANADVSYVPANDPVVPATPTETFDNAKYGSINARFNKVWLDAFNGRNGVPSLFAEAGVDQRFLDLRVTPTGDACADGAIVLAAGNNRLFAALCTALGAPEIAADPRFADNATRSLYPDDLAALLEARLATNSVAHWLDVIDAIGVPCGPLHNVAEALNYPQVRARNMVIDIAFPDGSPLIAAGNPVKLSGFDDPTVRAKSPALDEHRAMILADLGL